MAPLWALFVVSLWALFMDSCQLRDLQAPYMVAWYGLMPTHGLTGSLMVAFLWTHADSRTYRLLIWLLGSQRAPRPVVLTTGTTSIITPSVSITLLEVFAPTHLVGPGTVQLLLARSLSCQIHGYAFLALQ